MTVKFDIVVDSLSEVHGEYPGAVDVSFHREREGVRDGFETRRVPLSSEIINADGSVNRDRVLVEVLAMIGETEDVELEDV